MISRKPKVRSGIARGPKRVWPKHEQWVRGHQCVVPGCIIARTEFAHLRTAANSGVGLKPASWYGVAMCTVHHAEAHRIGHDTLAAKYGIDLWKLADEFVRLSPDFAMKAAMEESER